MNRLLIILILLTNFVKGFTQKLDKVILKASYVCEFKRNNRTIVLDTCELSVTDSSSYFYSLKKQSVFDELEKAMYDFRVNKIPMHLDGALTKRLTQFLPYTIFKKRNLNETYVIEKIGETDYGYKKNNLLNSKWIMVSDTFIINGLTSFKAIIEDSQHVTAWYLPNYPISDGPLSYSGLPGLIVKLESDSGWKIELLSIDNKISGLPNLITKMNYKVVLEEEFNKAKKAYNAVLLNNGMIEPNGAEFKIKKINN